MLVPETLGIQKHLVNYFMLGSCNRGCVPYIAPMKQFIAFISIILVGCVSSVPSKLYEKPERYRCELIIDTEWDQQYPVTTFQHVLKIGEVYEDRYFGTNYQLVPTEDPTVFALQVTIE